MADFDFVVVGSGMSGGWVAKELCERGFKVAVVERGREITPEDDYTDFLDPWDMKHLNWKSEALKEDYPIQSEVYAFHDYTKQFWVQDKEHPYETAPGTRYKWRRGYHVSGRSIMWGRQSYRMSEIDFQANARDGLGVDWPVRYADLKEWYDYAETFAGVSGNDDGIEVLPSGGTFQPPHEMTCVEKEWKKVIEEKWPTRNMIIGRVANLTEPTEEQLSLGRGKCQARNHCFRGCSYGAYFSSTHATLPAAERTGNLTLITDVAVHEVTYDAESNRATGIRGVNTKTMDPVEITGRAVFLNASTIPTAMILLNSVSDAMPNGLANSSGHVGHNLIGHVGGAWAGGTYTGFQDSYYFGRRPNGIYIPRYRNHTEPGEGFTRGFGFQGGATRSGWGSRTDSEGIGASLKDKVRTPGPWWVSMGAFGETSPRFENRVTLHASRTDKWGFPVPIMDCRYTDNEVNAIRQAADDAREMVEALGVENVFSAGHDVTKDTLGEPGNAIHEMGTCRMGHDPNTSVLNKWNQSHDVPNLFVSDGSFMTSAGCQNPSLSYMAFSARAAHHAADLMQADEI